MVKQFLVIIGLVYSVCATAVARPAFASLAHFIRGEALAPATQYRTTFTVRKHVVSARLYTTALGIYEVYLNGQRVGTRQTDGTMAYEELKPGWTDYHKRVFYLEHDVTALMTKRRNALAARVVPGWYGGRIARKTYGPANNAFMALLHISYADGTSQDIATDSHWQFFSDGAVRLCDIYDGETYDARCEDGWTTVDYRAKGWGTAIVDAQYSGDIVPFQGPQVRIVGQMEPVHCTLYGDTLRDSTTFGKLRVLRQVEPRQAYQLLKGQSVVYDMGQNFAGWVRFRVKGPAGATLRFRFAEMLNDTGDRHRYNDGPSGSLFTAGLRKAKATLTYTLAGNPHGEAFRPSGTFFGFRYVELTATAPVTVVQLTGEVVSADLPMRSSFRCSHEGVNRLFRNIQWGQRSNFISIPTDCPQRDERLGWCADTQLFSMAGLYNAQSAPFYRKWLADLRDSQLDDGAYPNVAPRVWRLGDGAGAWADAGIVVPWNVYLMTGDTTVISESMPSMERYMQWLRAQGTDEWNYQGGVDKFGDWLAFQPTDRRYVSVCYYAHDADLMARMCRALSHDDDQWAQKARGYEQLFDSIKAEYAHRYLCNGIPCMITQTSLLMPLAFQLLPDAAATKQCIALLREELRKNGGKMSTGFVGTALICQTLSEVGLNDEAFDLITEHRCPSWLYSVDQGATTIWERWDSYTRERGFNKNSMNSFNHYAYGAVAEWLYRYMTGIAPDERQPGFRHFILQPHPDSRAYAVEPITWAEGCFDSPQGMITSRWEKQPDGTVCYDFNIPSGTSATCYLPDGTTAELQAGHYQFKK